MSDFFTNRPSTPDAFAEEDINNLDDLNEQFEMFEVYPNFFISSWPSHLPSNITHSINLTTKESVAKNGPGSIEHWHLPLQYEGDFAQRLPIILYAINEAIPQLDLRSNPPPYHHSLLIYSEDGQTRAPAALLAYVCKVMQINVVDGYFELKKKKRDITIPVKCLQAIQDHLKYGEEYDDLEKEILRRLMARSGEIMKKAEQEEWMYEAGK